MFQLREYDIQIQVREGKNWVFDIIRKKYLLLTPEEWVRQHVIHHLVEDMNYPKALLAVEMPMVLNTLQKRCDIVVYNRQTKPVMIIECKASSVALSQLTLDQAARYNTGLDVQFIIITNGNHSLGYSIDHKKKQFILLDKLPEFNEMI